MAVLTQNKAKLFKNLITALVYEKNANFFAENCRKSQKIVIITSTPGKMLKADSTVQSKTSYSSGRVVVGYMGVNEFALNCRCTGASGVNFMRFRQKKIQKNN
jgi:phosphoribosylformylglycinamidine (FGAM) synthase-like amidotransferase family enzyme